MSCTSVNTLLSGRCGISYLVAFLLADQVVQHIVVLWRLLRQISCVRPVRNGVGVGVQVLQRLWNEPGIREVQSLWPTSLLALHNPRRDG